MSGQIYFIECGGRLKIGFSINVAKRFITLQNAAPRRLVLLGSIPGDKYVERRIHDCLRLHRLQGEWFKHNAEVRTFIRSLIDDGAVSVPEKLVPEKTSRPRKVYPPYVLPPWAQAIRDAKTLLEQHEQLILAAPKEHAREMFLIFADAVAELETILETDDVQAPIWFAAFEAKLIASREQIWRSGSLRK